MAEPSRPRILVTGGGTGIGAAIARRLDRDGAQVIVTGRRREPLEAIAAGTSIVPVTADVASTPDCEVLLTQITERFGGLDGVVANAGGHGWSTVGETSDEEWRTSLRANLDTAFVVVRQVLPELLRSRGSVVVISSLAGVRAAPESAGYTVGKHAVIGLVRSLARDYGKHGIRVNAICPGWIRTPMADQEMDVLLERGLATTREEAYALVARNVPLGRIGEPEEIAGVAAFLLSRDAAYVTGETVVADGGSFIVDVPTLDFG